MSPDSVFLECYVVLLGKPSSTFEELRSLETSVVIYSTTQHNIPDDLIFSNTAVRNSNITFIQFIFLQPYLLTTALICIIPSPYSCQVDSSVHIITWELMWIYHVPHLCYMLRPSHPPRFDCRHNIWVKSMYITCTPHYVIFYSTLPLSPS